jgi:hypothetical protein
MFAHSEQLLRPRVVKCGEYSLSAHESLHVTYR